MTRLPAITWARTRLASCGRESGQTMVFAVLVLVVAAGLATVMLSASTQQSQSTVHRKIRTGALPHLRSAAEKYGLALKLGLANENNGYMPSNWAPVLDAANDTQIATGSTAFPAASPTTIVERIVDASGGLATSSNAYWQIAKIDLPRYGNTGGTDYYPLTVYFRAWIGTPTTVSSDPRVFRVQYRPTLFSDYQLLTDGAIAIGPNFQVNGHVHTNGFIDGVTLNCDPDSPTRPKACIPGQGDPDRIWLTEGASVTCTSGYALLTTARGKIDPGVKAACPNNREGTERYVELTRAEADFTAMRAACGGDAVCL